MNILKSTIPVVFGLFILFPVCASAQNVGIGNTNPQSKLHITPGTAAAIQVDPFGGTAGQTGELRMLEITVNGTSYVGIKAPDSVATNVIWVLPNADGGAGFLLSTDGAGNLQWTDPSTLGGGGGSSNSHCFTCDGF